MKTHKAARWGAVLVAFAAGVGLSYWALNTWFPAPIEMARDWATDRFEPTTYDFRTSWMTEEARVVYPAEARRKNVEGSVILAMQIESDGRVASVRVDETSGHKGLDKAALDAAKHFKINPAQLNADAFPFEKFLKLTFRLEQAAPP